MTDPREWGGLNLSNEDLNMEAQAAALKSFKFDKETLKYSKEKNYHRKKGSVSNNKERDQPPKTSKRRTPHSPIRKRTNKRAEWPVRADSSKKLPGVSP